MTDDESLLDFNADARDRIAARIDGAGVTPGLARILAKPIDMAGGQLEYMKPAAFGMTARGLYGGAVAMVPKRTVLIVLANPKKVFQMRVQCLEAYPFAQVVKEAIDYVLQVAGKAPTPTELLLAVDDLIAKEGAAIGQRRKELSQEHCMRIMGLLFLPLQAPQLAGLMKAVEAMLDSGLCPALVGLTGPGSHGPKLKAGAWPVCFPLAPYAEQAFPPEPSSASLGKNGPTANPWSRNGADGQHNKAPGSAEEGSEPW